MTVAEMVWKLGGGEFDLVSAEDIAFWDELVSPMVGKKKFGRLYNQAKALLICHKMTLNGVGENGLGGAVRVKNSYSATSVSDGGSSISFASVGAGRTEPNTEYGMTVYGTQYLQLVRTSIVPIRISGEGGYP